MLLWQMHRDAADALLEFLNVKYVPIIQQLDFNNYVQITAFNAHSSLPFIYH